MAKHMAKHHRKMTNTRHAKTARRKGAKAPQAENRDGAGEPEFRLTEFVFVYEPRDMDSEEPEQAEEEAFAAADEA